MYFFDFLKNIVQKKNIGMLIWLVFNTVFVTYVLGYCFGGEAKDYFIGAATYIIVLALSISPIGEAVLRRQCGCNKITRKEYLERLMPLFEEVYAKAKAKNPEIPDNVKMYMSDDDEPNAFATGRRTVCVTKGLLGYSNQQIKAVLSHEFGHLAHKDTDAILVISVGNFLVAIIFVICRIIFKFCIHMVALLVGYISESFAIGFVSGATATLIDGLLGVAMALWTKLGALLCLHSVRQNENLADRYAFELGYGEYLCSILDSFGSSNAKGLWATLHSSHPSNDSRIAYLQSLGCAYRA